MYLMTNNMSKKLLAILLCLSFSTSVALASPSKKWDTYTNIKNKAYKTLAEVLYNDDVYMPLRLEIINKLVRLGQRSEDAFKITDITFNNKLYRNVRTENTQEGDPSGVLPRASLDQGIQRKVLSTLDHIDKNQETLILSRLLDSKNKILDGYAKKVIAQVPQQGAEEYFVGMLNKTSNKYPLLLTLSKEGALKPIIDQLEKVDEDNYVQIEQILSSMVLAKREHLVKFKGRLIPLLKPFIKSEIENIAFYACVLLVALDYEPVLEHILTIAKENNTLADLLTSSGITIMAASNSDTACQFFIKLYNSENNTLKVSILSNAYLMDNKNFPRIEYLKEALKDRNQNVAGGALISAAIIGEASLSDDIMRCLKELYLDNLFLSKYSKLNKANLDVVTYILEHSSTKNKLLAAEILLTIGDNDYKANTVKVLQQLLQDTNTEIVFLAANLLEQNNYTIQNSYLKKLVLLMNPDGYNNEYINAVIMLAKAGDTSVIPQLKEIIDLSNNRNLVTICAFLLLKLGDTLYLPIVRSYLSDDLNEIVPDKYLSFDEFNPLLTDSNEMIKLNTAIILSKTHPQNIVKTLEELTSSSNIKVRAKSASFLSYIDSYNDISKLVSLLDDSSARVRINAAESILRIMNRNHSE